MDVCTSDGMLLDILGQIKGVSIPSESSHYLPNTQRIAHSDNRSKHLPLRQLGHVGNS